MRLSVKLFGRRSPWTYGLVGTGSWNRIRDYGFPYFVMLYLHFVGTVKPSERKGPSVEDIHYSSGRTVTGQNMDMESMESVDSPWPRTLWSPSIPVCRLLGLDHDEVITGRPLVPITCIQDVESKLRRFSFIS